MKKHNHPINNFFRETLDDHQMVPSDAAKKAFLRDVIQAPKSEKKDRRGLILISLLLALVGTGITIWTITSDKFSSNINPESKPSVPHITTSHQESRPAINHNSNDNSFKNHGIIPSSITRNQQPLTQLLKQTLKQQSSFEQPQIIQHPAESQTQVADLKPLLPPLAKETPATVSKPENPGDAADISNEARSTLNITSMKPIRQDSVSKPLEMRPDSIIRPGHKSNWTPPEIIPLSLLIFR